MRLIRAVVGDAQVPNADRSAARTDSIASRRNCSGVLNVGINSEIRGGLGEAVGPGALLGPVRVA